MLSWILSISLVQVLYWHWSLNWWRSFLVVPIPIMNKTAWILSQVCMICTKGCPSKYVYRIFFDFAISQLIQHQNLKILVPTPHNYQGIMYLKRIFKLWCCKSWKIAKTQNMRETFLLGHPLYMFQSNSVSPCFPECVSVCDKLC